MTEAEFQKLQSRVMREWPVRRELAKMLGVRLEDQTIAELAALVTICAPEHAARASKLIGGILRSPQAIPEEPKR